jgi:hypothetical protein
MVWGKELFEWLKEEFGFYFNKKAALLKRLFY